MYLSLTDDPLISKDFTQAKEMLGEYVLLWTQRIAQNTSESRDTYTYFTLFGRLLQRNSHTDRVSAIKIYKFREMYEAETGHAMSSHGGGSARGSLITLQSLWDLL